MNLRNRKALIVAGLPSFAEDYLLRRSEWYGQFKGLASVEIDHDASSGYQPRYQQMGMYDLSKLKDSIQAFIVFDNELSALQAKEFSNSSTFADGRILYAEFAVTHYCKTWLANIQCNFGVDCRYRHGWCPQTDVVTRDENKQHKESLAQCGLQIASYIPLPQAHTLKQQQQACGQVDVDDIKEECHNDEQVNNDQLEGEQNTEIV